MDGGCREGARDDLQGPTMNRGPVVALSTCTGWFRYIATSTHHGRGAAGTQVLLTLEESPAMKRFATVLLASALLASPLFALDATQAKKDVATATAAPAKAAEPMDINSATAKQLATLDGIGDARSAAIVKGRPYNGKDDLVNKKIIPQDVYDKIKDKIIAKQTKEKAKK